MTPNNMLEADQDTMADNRKKRLIVVMGMHRSGTSTVARGLQVMGIELGDNLLPAMEGINDKGFWEDVDIYALNNELLDVLGSDWHHLAPIKPAEVEALRERGYFAKAANLIFQKVEKINVFGFKDPRVAKLLPFWKEVFIRCQFDTSCVLVVRHPLSVAKSLAKRDGFDAEKSYYLWLGHIIESLADSAGMERVLVDYDKLMQSPESQINRIAKRLDLRVDPVELESYITQFLDKTLQHTVYNLDDLSLDEACPPLVRELYTKLLAAAADEISLDDPMLCKKMEQWVDEWQRLEPILTLIDRFTTRNVIVSGGLAEGIERISDLSQTVAERNAQITKLEQVVVEQKSQLDNLNRALVSRDDQLRTVYASRSWKISAPIRWTGSQARHVMALGRALALAKSHAGGPVAALNKGLHILQREGWPGIHRRLLFFRDRGSLTWTSNTEETRYNYGLGNTTKNKALLPHTQYVDVIVCIHNALDDVRRCLESIVANTYPPYRLVIIDDGSDEDTRNFLEQFVVGQSAKLIRNDSAIGYTKAANVGLKSSKSDFAVLLNSDTVVPPRWLDRLIRCALSHDRIGMVGPLSNTASWQSVPRIFNERQDWAENPLPSGWTVADYADEVASASQCIYPRVGFLNGFCLLIKRKLIKDLGFFDENAFGQGYGEENDYCLRAVAKGWQLAVADDCFVLHSQSKSYSHERREHLSRLAGEALAAKHDPGQIVAQVTLTREHLALEYARKRCEQIAPLKKCRDEITFRYEGKRILFLLPAGSAGGGGNIVLLECRTMRMLGVDAWVANLEIHRELFERSHPGLAIPILYLHSQEELSEYAAEFDAVIATLYSTVSWLKPLLALERVPRLGYYIQDFEPDFFSRGSAEYQEALASYTAIPGMRLFTKTEWNRSILRNTLGVTPEVIGPSLDIDLFYPSATQKRNKEVISIMAMVRPSTPRRAPQATLRILKRVAQRYQERVEISLFGAHPDDPQFLCLDRNFPHKCLGELTSEQVAEALIGSDIFIDCSLFQAMGLTAMEAMASGVAVVGPANGGLPELIVNEQTGLLVDTSNEEAIFLAVMRLINDVELRKRIQQAAISIVQRSPVVTVQCILNQLFTSALAPDNFANGILAEKAS